MLAISNVIHQFHLSTFSSDTRIWSIPFRHSLFCLSSQALLPVPVISFSPIRRFGLPWRLQKSKPICGKLPGIEPLLWTLSNLSTPTFPFVLTFAPFAHQRRNLTFTCFPFGNYGEKSFIWSIFVGGCWAMLCTSSSRGKPSRITDFGETRTTFLHVFIWAVWKEAIGV